MENMVVKLKRLYIDHRSHRSWMILMQNASILILLAVSCLCISSCMVMHTDGDETFYMIGPIAFFKKDPPLPDYMKNKNIRIAVEALKKNGFEPEQLTDFSYVSGRSGIKCATVHFSHTFLWFGTIVSVDNCWGVQGYPGSEQEFKAIAEDIRHGLSKQ
ncbi:MAG: hypothetical protein HQL20_09605 [Candidatus Omnitrophica bacterium]|nr:hypothetical protein [Candidatus Omnitrophota bacterium]